MDFNKKIKEELRKPIVMLGMMGCGKSYVSEALARKYSLKLFDMDAMIEKMQGMNIPEIFENFGETHFRLLETELLVNLLEKGEMCVISTGGGIVGRQENMRAIADMGISVWLKADVPVLLDRVGGGEGRPMLLQGGNPSEALERLLNEREDLYSKADIHIENNGDVDAEVIADQILKAVALRVDKEKE